MFLSNTGGALITGGLQNGSDNTANISSTDDGTGTHGKRQRQLTVVDAT